MPSRVCFAKSDTLTSTSTQWNLDAIDLSHCDELTVTYKIVTTITSTSNTLDIYVQSRGRDGFWDDRIHFTQIAATPNQNKAQKLVLQQFGTFSDTEEASVPSSSSGGTRLAAGTVKNGPFPRPYVDASAPATAWRVDFVMAGTTGGYSVEVVAEANSSVPN